jgi:predicted DNA binding CopG/RHH family protein
MNTLKSDDYEKRLIASIEAEEWDSVNDLAAEVELARQIARNTAAKDDKITIRISGRDLELLKSMAMDQGMPYQTMVTSVLHKYATGKLKETTS